MTNKTPVFRSRDLSQLIRGQSWNFLSQVKCCRYYWPILTLLQVNLLDEKLAVVVRFFRLTRDWRMETQGIMKCHVLCPESRHEFCNESCHESFHKSCYGSCYGSCHEFCPESCPESCHEFCYESCHESCYLSTAF